MKRAVFCVVSLMIFAGASPSPAITQGTEKSPETPQLTPGDYVWQPEASPDGPVVIVIDLSKQRMQVFRNGTLIGRSTVSSGRENYETPTGIFTVLKKDIDHHSTAYHEASMPFSERLTWDGVAIHAGTVPDHPDSHGCVHVPMKFAKNLYGITAKGCTVMITKSADTNAPPTRSDLEFAGGKGSPPAPKTPGAPPFSWKPEASPDGPLSVVYSSADGQVYVYRGGTEIGVARVGSGAGPSVGNRIYAAQAQTNPQGFHEWNLLGSLESSPAPNAEEVLGQLAIPDAFRDDMKQAVTPGTTLVMTDESVDKELAKKNSSAILDTADK